VNLIDLRSDTVTRPTPGMRAAMASAEVGDDIYREDPTTRALEETGAALFGRPGAVFMPTVTMANQICLSLLAGPGDEVICELDAHLVRYEGGAAAAVGGIQTRTVASPDGRLPLTALRHIVRAGPPGGGSSGVRTAAVAVEQTHNQSGGRVYPIADLVELRAFADATGLGIHCDGARIWNAHAATGVPLATYGAQFDALAVCLSKGLGCPAGALAVFVDEAMTVEARRLRRRLGGAMRQVGILAAAGLYGLRHHLDRLADDHAHARQLAEAVETARPGTVDGPVETNIVYLDLPTDSLGGFVAACREEGVLVTVVHGRRARLVTHLEVDDAATGRAAKVLTAAVRTVHKGQS
jgi:threonine aldolase